MSAQNLSGSMMITNLGKECDRLVSKAASAPTALYKKTLLKVTSHNNPRIVSKPLQQILYMTQEYSELTVPQFPLPSCKRMWFLIIACKIYFRKLTQSIWASNLSKICEI